MQYLDGEYNEGRESGRGREDQGVGGRERGAEEGRGFELKKRSITHPDLNCLIIGYKNAGSFFGSKT